MKKNRFLLVGMTALLTFALVFAGCDDGSSPDPIPLPDLNPIPFPNPNPNPNPGGAETGLYMGIIGFNENVTRREIGLLNTGNKGQFQGFIDGLTMQPATGLYYAVDTGINMLQQATLPNDLVNVSIVTFTDGLDNASIAINPNYNSRDSYRDAVSVRLSNTKIKNLNISAYSIGVKGGDVVDETAYLAGLGALASSQANVTPATNMAEVEQRFEAIADSLYNVSQSQSIRLRLSGGYDNGDKIRFTFDNVTDAADSNLYIEGIFTRSGNARSLQNVVYQGLTSNSGTTVNGSITGVYVYFTFENTSTTSGNDVSMGNVQQWQYITSQTLWQRNSEFGGAGDTETIVDRKSAVIMLVLDCTSSLNAGGANGFSEMKSAAKRFIDVLVSGSGGQPNPGTGPGTEASPISLTAGAWANGSITSTTSGSAVWYSFNVASGTRYYVWWNDEYAGNSTKTLDVKVSAYYSSGTSIFTGVDSGWASSQQFTAGSSGMVKVKVEPYSASYTGTFAVAYSTGSTRPNL